MSPEIMWSLLIALGAITVGAVLHAVESGRKLHLSDEELSGARKKLDTLKQQHQQTISDTEKLHLTEKDKLSKRVSELENQIALQRKKPIKSPTGGGGKDSWMR